MDDIIQQNQAQFDRVCEKMKKLMLKKQKLKEQEPIEVIKGLFLGNLAQALNKTYLAEKGIKLVISCLKIEGKDRCEGVEYREMVVRDQPEQRICDLFEQFISLVKAHLPGQTSCLVNCFSAKSRSPTLVLAYLIRTQNLNFQQAFILLKAKCPDINPNKGFITQLKEFAEKQRIQALQHQKEIPIKLQQIKQPTQLIKILQSQKDAAEEAEQPIKSEKQDQNHKQPQIQFQSKNQASEAIQTRQDRKEKQANGVQENESDKQESTINEGQVRKRKKQKKKKQRKA